MNARLFIYRVCAHQIAAGEPEPEPELNMLVLGAMFWFNPGVGGMFTSCSNRESVVRSVATKIRTSARALLKQ